MENKEKNKIVCFNKISTYFIILFFFPTMIFIFTSTESLLNFTGSKINSILLAIAITLLMIVINANELSKFKTAFLSPKESKNRIMSLVSTNWHSVFAFTWLILLTIFSKIFFEKKEYIYGYISIFFIIIMAIAFFYWTSNLKKKFIKNMQSYSVRKIEITNKYLSIPIFLVWIYYHIFVSYIVWFYHVFFHNNLINKSEIIFMIPPVIYLIYSISSYIYYLNKLRNNSNLKKF